MIQITEEGGYLLISFPYDLQKIEALKKNCPKAWYDKSNKVWKATLYWRKDLEKWKAQFQSPDIEPAQPPQRYEEIPPLPELTREIPLLLKPFPYQNQGIAYILEKRRVLIGDQPGLGKTGQAIAAVFSENAFPCIVVCPNTLKENWRREWEKWTGMKAMILTDKVKTTWQMYAEVKMCQVFIVNYESLEKYFVLGYDKPPEGKEHEKGRLKYVRFRDSIQKFKSIIADESHKLKNASTRQTKLTAGLASWTDMRLLLSGTAMVNGPRDLWPQMAILGFHSKFGKEADFIKRYCEVGPARKPGNLKELNYWLNKLGYYRREKREVLKDLPPKVRTIWYCDITTRKEYDRAETDFIQYLQEVKKCTPEEQAKKLRGGFMVKMGILKNISARGKMNEVKQYVEDITGAGEKIVLFAYLKEMVREIAKLFKNPLMIYGDVKQEDRQRAVDLFQTDPRYPGIVCNTESGGVGLTLTAASRVGIVEEPYTFASVEQCEDRVHRVGQRGMSEGLESIDSTIFLGKDTIDEYIHFDIVMRKKDIQDEVLGAKDQARMEVVDGLLKFFKARNEKKIKEEKGEFA